jgi:ribosomal 50S subunit-recycling heat shock protein
MRLDKFLKVSRIIKRRTLANEACDAGKVWVNGKPVKAGFQVKTGDLVELKLARRPVRVEILSLNEAPGKGDAAAMYKALQTEEDDSQTLLPSESERPPKSGLQGYEAND